LAGRSIASVKMDHRNNYISWFWNIDSNSTVLDHKKPEGADMHLWISSWLLNDEQLLCMFISIGIPCVGWWIRHFVNQWPAIETNLVPVMGTGAEDVQPGSRSEFRGTFQEGQGPAAARICEQGKVNCWLIKANDQWLIFHGFGWLMKDSRLAW
jgi:hypothetical protein